MRAIILAALLASIAIMESSADGPVENAAAHLFLVVASIFLLFATAHLAAHITAAAIRNSAENHTLWLRLFTVFQHAFTTAWLITIALVFFVADWIPLVRFNWGWHDWLLVDELILLLPVVIPLIGSWFARYEVEYALEVVVFTNAGMRPPAPERMQFILLHTRYYLGLTFAPLVVLFGLTDFSQWMRWDNGTPLQFLVYLIPMAVLLVLSPVLLRRIWSTESLPPGPLREGLTRISTTQQLNIRDILVWRTGLYVINAAVAGIVPWCRYLMLSDGLLESLSEKDIRAIFLHEGGHIRRGHNLLRILVLATPLLLLISIESFAPEILQAVWSAGKIAGLSTNVCTFAILPILAVSYGVLVVGGFCRAFELEADFWACGKILAGCPTITPAAAEQYSTALLNLSAASGQDPSKSSWLHPSTQYRVNFLRCAARSPKLARQFQFNMRLLRLGVLLAVAALPVLLAISTLRG
ncbi:MAG: Zn-dependent protease with chaperone function [Pirellulaceae bacterium]|jgi:Zn-dependent protease with chaperone function